jgi:hypothetical protein
VLSSARKHPAHRFSRGVRATSRPSERPWIYFLPITEPFATAANRHRPSVREARERLQAARVLGVSHGVAESPFGASFEGRPESGQKPRFSEFACLRRFMNSRRAGEEGGEACGQPWASVEGSDKGSTIYPTRSRLREGEGHTNPVADLERGRPCKRTNG